MGAHRITPTEKTCPNCGTVFLVGGRGRPRKSQVYCTQKCNALARTIQPSIAMLAHDDAVYLAGLFDGEGSIILWDRGYGGRPQLRCSISNTHPGVLEWVRRITETGSIVKHEWVKAEQQHYKTSLTWQCYGQNAVSLLKQMLPRLIIKRERALEAIASQPDRHEH